MSFFLSEGDARRSSQQKHFRMRSLSQRDRAAVCDHLTGSKTRKPQQAFQLAESSSVCPSGTCRLNLRRKLRDTSWSTRRWWQEPRGEVHTHRCIDVTGWFCSWIWLARAVVSPSELKEAQRKKRQMKERHRQEDSISNAMVIWNTEILPHWDSMYVSTAVCVRAWVLVFI